MMNDKLFNIFNRKSFTSGKKSGGSAVVSVEVEARTPITKLLANLGDPVQDLHGYANPWPGGGGKNLVDMSSVTREYFIRAGNVSADSPLGTPIHNASWSCSDYIAVESSTLYTQTLPGYNAAGAAGLVFFSDKSVASAISGVPTTTQGSATYTFTTPSNCHYVRISWQTSNEGSGSYPYPQLEKGAKTSYAPYSNICPISGLTGLSVYVSPAQDPDDATVYAVDWTDQAGTVYGGTLDVVAGVLTANRITYAFDGTESFSNYTSVIVCNKDMPVGYSVAGSDILCSHGTNAYIHFSNSSKNRVQFDKAYFGVTSADELKTLLANWNTAGTPLQYSYELATPVEYHVGRIPMYLMPGINYVWLSDGLLIDEFEYYEFPEGGVVCDAYIDGDSMQADGWFVKWRRLSAPQPKTDYTSVYGRDGSIDLTEESGDVFYEDRTVNLDMVYIGEDWNDAYSKLLNAIHGQKCAVQFTDDPYWYWAARLVASEFEHKTHSLTMNGVAFPYKLSIFENSYQASVNGAVEGTATELQLEGSRMRVSPQVVVTGEVTLKWGTKTATLSAGTYYVRGLKVGPEGVTLKVWGTGTVAITYREGSL